MATSPATDVHSPIHMDGILLAEELLDLAERAQAYTNAAGVAIALRRGQDLVVRTSTGAAPEVGGIIPLSDAFIADCLRSRRPLCCRDADSDNRVGPVFRAMKTRSLIAIPICEHRDAKGVMIVIAPLPNAFQPTHTAILLTLSDIIASKLAARDAMPPMGADAEMPSLTGVAPAAPVPPPAKPAASVASVFKTEAPIAPAPVPKLSPPAAKPPAPVAKPPASFAKPAFVPAPVANPAPVEAAASASVVPTPAPKPLDLAWSSHEHSKPLPAEPPFVPDAVPAASVPPALLREAAMPLPVDVDKTEAAPDPGLLSPSEDPTRFKPVRPIASGTTLSAHPDFMSITVKPVSSSAVAPAPQASPVHHPAPQASPAPPVTDSHALPVTPTSLPPLALHTAPTFPLFPATADAKAALADVRPAIASWETPSVQSGKPQTLLGAAAVAAGLVLVAGLWLYHSATKEVPAPVATAVPSPVTATVAPAVNPAPVPLTINYEPATKPAVIKPEQPKESKPAPAAAVDETRRVPAPVMEIATGKPMPKQEPQPEIQAPKLALASNDATLNSIGKLPVAVPGRPKSELVPATLLSRVAPTFPAIAKQMGVYGAVRMSVTISPEGTVSAVRVISGDGQLQRAAVAAVQQWRYKPARLNGQPTESTAEVQINFSR